MVSSTLASGCLVTESIDFPVEENLPPAIVESTPPLNRVVNVEPGATEFLDFGLVIRDANVEQRLIAKIYIDRINGGAALQTGKDVLVSGEEERPLQFLIETDTLGVGPACRRLETLISSEFDVIDTDTPVDPNDLATGVWWLNVRSPEGVGANLDSCQ